MWKRFSLRSRLILILLTVSLLAAGIVIVLGAMVGNESITREVNERLVSARNAKAFEVEQYFTSLSNVVEVLADNDLSGRAVIEFSQSFNAINEVDTIDCSAELNDFYVDFIDRLSERLEVRRSVSAFYPQSPAACYLQYHYLVRNDNPVGAKDRLMRAPDNSVYSGIHARYHNYYQQAAERFGFYDIFLIDAATSNIIYSTFKEVDFGTNLLNGPYRNSNLAALVDKVRRNADLKETQIVDFELYRPSLGLPAAFMGAPIYYRDEFVGILAAQLPIDEINNIMTYGGEWAENGLGETGEALLVGDDYYLRSDSRLYIEDTTAFIQSIADQTLDEEMLERLTHTGPILTIPLKSENLERAISGEAGLMRIEGYQGDGVLSAYTPLHLPGNLNWSLVTEIHESEAMRPVRRFQRLNLSALALIIVLITILAMAITRSLIKPIDRLTAGAEEVRAGNTSVRVEKTADDEMGRLTEVFNSMVASIDRQKTEIAQQASENDALLFSRFPAAVAERFRNGERNIVDQFESVAVLSCDLRGTEELSSLDAEEAWQVVQELTDKFAAASEELGMEVVNPVPDGYLVVCGMNIPRLDNGRRIAILGMELKSIVESVDAARDLHLNVNIGIGHGPVLAGILHGQTDNYMVWGPTVDRVQRLAASERPNLILGERRLIDLLTGNFHFDDEREVRITESIIFTAGTLRGRVSELQIDEA